MMPGINDISWPGTAFAPNASRPTLNALTAGYRQWVASLAARKPVIPTICLPRRQRAGDDLEYKKTGLSRFF
ncbi:hypothetical protein [Martelella alba]|uniref:hypothetical protein n=1 Tax=Martelella alba TaxID=2590451 RepID=UPI001E609775|nr:hypothetical protein [Martelella alba]